MARPIKKGLDYFPLDVDMDDKVELIEAKHGIAGFGILIKLMQRIYKSGYYLKLTEEVLLLISKRVNVELTLLNDVINACLRYGIFDNNMYLNHNILTSSGIQKRYFEATKKRKDVKTIEKYIISEETIINSELTNINTEESTQSKVKEIKEKKRKVNNGGIDFSQILILYDYCQNLTTAKNEWEKLDEYEQQEIKEHIPKYIERHNEAGKHDFLPDLAKYLYEQKWKVALPYRDSVPKKAKVGADGNYLKNERGEIIYES